ncbi:Ankyrin repeat domain-containing protein 50 [Cladobotryum mycophilum]|uniref:Ankyrin repeat domain-containing protein 50 n=1 Tax=Cladobotryum mycophilum TaxID=491253 RepID=A0ABR0SMY4_9HYPO
MQFIGLRGMKAWVSLAQLAITVVMSILRGLLRMRRLGNDANELSDIPDLVSGYELDWLANRISSQEKSPDRWHITGQLEAVLDAEGVGKDESLSAEYSQSSKITLVTLPGDPGHNNLTSPTSPKLITKPLDALSSEQFGFNKILRIRQRLGHLTGHLLSESQGEKFTGYQMWKDGHVKVRAKARELSIALSQVASDLIVDDSQRKIILRLSASPFNRESTTFGSQTVSVDLQPPLSSLMANWTVNSAQIEAILGLWLWTLVSDRRIKTDGNDESIRSILPAEMVNIERVIASGPDDKEWSGKAVNVQGEMDLWLGPGAISFEEKGLKIDMNQPQGLGILWRLETDISQYSMDIHSQNLVAVSHKYEARSTKGLSRLCGWNAIPEFTTSPTSSEAQTVEWPSLEQTSVNLRVQIMRVSRTDSSLLETYETKIVKSAGTIHLENTTVSKLADSFVKSGLGSYSNALLCLIPALRERLPSPDPNDLLTTIIDATTTYRQKAAWKKGGSTLRWACSRFSAVNSELCVKALRATGEFYRYSLAKHSDSARIQFGLDGIKWMTQTFGDQNNQTSEILTVLTCYETISRNFNSSSVDLSPRPEGNQLHEKLITALQTSDETGRSEALYYLCFISQEDSHYDKLQNTLSLAVSNNWDEVVDALLEMKINVNGKDKEGRTALFICALKGYYDYAKLLIKHGAYVNTLNAELETPLHAAAAKGHGDIVKLLLDSGFGDVNIRDKKLRSPLTHAAVEGHEHVIRHLFDSGFVDVNICDDEKMTPLFERGHLLASKLLLDFGVNANTRDGKLMTPLLYAARKGHLLVSKLLLDFGADINALNRSGRSPLSFAALKGDTAMVQLLCDNGAKILPGMVHDGVWGGNGETLQILVDNGADINGSFGEKNTPLIYAAEIGVSPATIQLLIKNGANIESKNHDGWTALHLATHRRHEGIVEQLIKNGADMESKTSQGWTALHLAYYHQKTGIVQLLIKSGADLESKTSYGWTTLHWASYEGHEEVVQLLIKKGAKIESKTFYGWTALHWALQKCQDSVVGILLNRGAKYKRLPKNWDFRWAFRHAMKQGYMRVLGVLLENDVRVDTWDEDQTEFIIRSVTPLKHVHSRQSIMAWLSKVAKDCRNKEGAQPMPEINAETTSKIQIGQTLPAPADPHMDHRQEIIRELPSSGAEP